jgi:hypothetical protein
MIEKCDMCGSEIMDGRCACGVWESREEMEGNPIPKAIEYFHEMRRFTLTTDMPHLGCGAVFFRGDYNDCKKVEKFIHSMKGRPYYLPTG